MNLPSDMHAPVRIPSSDPAIGSIIGIATLLAILMMAHHPTVSAHGMPEVVAEIARKAALDRYIHGGLIALLAALLFGFGEYSARAGMDRPLVRAALLAYAIGVAASIGAALINGIVAPELSLRYVGADAAALEQLRHLLRLCWRGNQALAGLGEIGRGLGVVLWSCALLRLRRNRVLAVFGLLAGGVPALAIAAGALRLDLHGAILALSAPAAWNLALAVQLLRGKA